MSTARALVALFLLGSTSCAGPYAVRSIEDVGFLSRKQTQEEDGVRATTAVPSAREARALFGEPLYRRGVQPVWLEIENKRSSRIEFLPVGLDPMYYSPIEAANLDLKVGSRPSFWDRNLHFFVNAMEPWIEPGAVQSGFVFTSLDEGTKAFNLEFIAEDKYITFTFFVPVPGLKLDHHEVDWESLYPPEEIVDLSAEEAADRIATQHCCATDKSGKGNADPLNLVVIGDPDDVYYAFIHAGWDETETINRSSTMKTIMSFLSGGEYRYSPVSSLFVFGRKQDVAFQKARDNIHKRNHLRLWMSPWRLEGKSIWMGQISRDIGVRFTRKTITTHKIDPDVDETREFLLENLAYSQSLRKFAYALGVGEAPMDEPRGNLTGDPYFTDGYRLVLWVTSTPVDIADLEVVRWATSPNRQ